VGVDQGDTLRQAVDLPGRAVGGLPPVPVRGTHPAGGAGDARRPSRELYLPDGGLREFYDTTVGYQLGRYSPFSLWGRCPGLGWVATVLKVAAAGLAVAVAFVPRQRDTARMAALGAAVLIATQIPVVHWFYFYVVWFAPFVLVALFAEYRVRGSAEPPT
jgi:hypothetical protein